MTETDATYTAGDAVTMTDRIEQIRANLSVGENASPDCRNCNEHVLLAEVDRLRALELERADDWLDPWVQTAFLATAELHKAHGPGPWRECSEHWCRLVQQQGAQGALDGPSAAESEVDRLAQIAYETWHRWFRQQEVERGTRMASDTYPWSHYEGHADFKASFIAQVRAVVAAFLGQPVTMGTDPTDPPWVKRGFDGIEPTAGRQWAQCTACSRLTLYLSGQGNFPGRSIEHADGCEHNPTLEVSDARA